MCSSISKSSLFLRAFPKSSAASISKRSLSDVLGLKKSARGQTKVTHGTHWYEQDSTPYYNRKDLIKYFLDTKIFEDGEFDLNSKDEEEGVFFCRNTNNNGGSYLIFLKTEFTEGQKLCLDIVPGETLLSHIALDIQIKFHLCNVLMENILVLNKPGGLPMQGASYTEDVGTGSIHDTDLSIADILPNLHKAIKSESLNIVYAQHRQYSGIIVLAKNEEATKSYSRYFTHVRTNKVPCQTYWAVTLGIPSPTLAQNEIFPVQRQRVEGWTLSIKSKHSLKQRKDGNMILSQISLETLKVAKSSQYRAALVQLQPTTIKWDALNVFLLHKMAPILGDHKYSCRLKHVLGRPILMEPKTHLPATQELPQELQMKLGLRENEECAIIPLHLHCKELKVPQIHAGCSWKSSNMLTFTASIPSFFQKTLTTLHLLPDKLNCHLPS